MTIKQCYQAMGADFEEISQRIPSEALYGQLAQAYNRTVELLRAVD